MPIRKVEGALDMHEDRSFFLPRGFSDVSRTSPDTVADPKLWVIFRAAVSDPSDPPLREFKARGYETERTLEYKTEVGSIFAVELVRR